MTTSQQATNTVTATPETTNTVAAPSASIYGGGYWASSPAQISFFAMLKAMEAQMDAANAYADYQEEIWDPNNENSMFKMWQQEIYNTERAKIDEADQIRFQAGESIGSAVCSVANAAGSFIPGGQESKNAQKAVENSTGAQKGITDIQNKPSRADTGAGDPEAIDPNDQQTQAVLARLKTHRFDENDSGEGLEHRPLGDGTPSYKEALECQDPETVNEHAELINKQVDNAYGRRNAAENTRQRYSQIVSGISNMLQGINTATMKFYEAEQAVKQGEDNALATAARNGKDTMDKICETDRQANLTAINNASQILQILASLEKAG
jgi:hypothetical protein